VIGCGDGLKRAINHILPGARIALGVLDIHAVKVLLRHVFQIEIGRDPVGIPPPNIVLKSQVQIGERKTRVNGRIRTSL
jgi:hypothetical protein